MKRDTRFPGERKNILSGDDQVNISHTAHNIGAGSRYTQSLLLRYIFVAGLCLLSPLTNLKLGDIAPAELFCFVCFLFTAAFISNAGLVIRLHPVALSLLKKYMLFVTVALVLAITNLRLETYPPPDIGLLKTAPYLSFARAGQLVLDMGCLILLINIICSRPNLIRLLTQCYVYAGLLNALYGAFSWAGMFAGIELGGAYAIDFPRARGFFVEGGPFGVYLVSVILVTTFRRRVLRIGNPYLYWFQLTLLFTALLVSYSKAGLLLLGTMTFYYALVTNRFRYVMAVIAVALLLFGTIPRLSGSLVAYASDYINFNQVVLSRSDDSSLVMGRLMASVLVPIMVVNHPWLGLGLGNYSLQRNNPDFLGGLPTADGWDLPGLGLLGYIAELGIPLFIYLCWILWRPVSIAKMNHAPPFVILLSSYQIFAHLFGVQLTFVYPWILSAIGIGYAITMARSKNKRDPTNLLFDSRTRVLV